MTLECELRDPIKNATAADIQELIANDESRGVFLILAQAPEIYIQCAGTSPPYNLEYRDGDSDHHYAAPDVHDKKELEQIFLWYLTNDPRWRLLVHWKKNQV